jgi:hypothetical protein
VTTLNCFWQNITKKVQSVFKMNKDTYRSKNIFHHNVITTKAAIICGVNIFHLLLNIFILCYVIIWNYNSRVHLSELFLNLRSHATKDTIYKVVQKHIKRPTTFPISNDFFEWFLILNLLITIARIAFL